MTDNDDSRHAWPAGCPPPRDLNDYVDGSLAAPRHGEIERHLTDCHDCRVWVSDLFTVIALLGDPHGVPAPRSFRLGPEHRTRGGGTRRGTTPNGDPTTR